MRASLTSRLVATMVVLLFLVSVAVAAFTTIALRTYLLNQRDADVLRSAERWNMPGRQNSLDEIFQGRNQKPGTLVAVIDGGVNRAVVLGTGPGEQDTIDLTKEDDLTGVRADGNVHQIQVDSHGTYRVVAQSIVIVGAEGSTNGILMIGLPTADISDAIGSLVLWESAFIAVGLLVASGVGVVVVRRQLRPLREVAATAHEVASLPLAAGEVVLPSRVPESLTRENNEVGEVGAALNALLDHVEGSLAARHKSEQQVRQFVADASHELRTPLTTIRGYADLASQRPEEMQTALAKVKEESARMSGLVESLLQLARLDAGRPLQFEAVDVTQLVVEAVADARVVAPDHQWRMVLPEDPVTVRADAVALHQVVTNLLTNARKYTPAGSTITVTVEPDGFLVHDDGPGFSPDLVESAFERFVRGDASRTRSETEGGAGLGLALVKAIVQAHGGDVTLRSAPGDTTITVRLD